MIRQRVLAIAAIAMAGCIAPVANGAGELAPPVLRLPDGARPLRYALTLTIVPGEPGASGEIAIDVELAREHSLLWLNAEAIVVSRASVGGATSKVSVVTGHDQFVGLAFDPPLPAGRHRLALDFEAEQSRNTTRGIFALQDAGAWYAMTHFEPTSARRAFPSFDEPGFKVPWQLTLRVPRDLVALSNTPVLAETPAGEGMKAVRFAETRALPTYLVAFAVGPWETVNLGSTGRRPTPMRIVVPRGRTAEAAFAARAYPELFVRMERWFGIPHPYEKLDHIAIPLTVGFAMENQGLITYGAPNLLAKPDAVSPRFRRVVANLGAHEMAHQWFGNLVTMTWWDDLWLNEAFATWFAEKMVDRWRPAYEHGAGRAHARAQAIDSDALASARRIREPIVTRGDIRNAFDAITYQKGATVIAMFERWIGEAPFRRGVQRYLKASGHGNATVHEFLGALSSASGLPVAPAFTTFLEQNGVPQIAVELACLRGRAQVTLSQHRHVPVGSTAAAGGRWQVPVCVRYGGPARPRTRCTLLDTESTSLPLGGGCPAFVLANAGGSGYYVADHRGDLLARLAKHRRSLSPAEHAGLLYDLRALLRAGAVRASEALDWVQAAGASNDRHVVLAAIELATFVRDSLAGEAERARMSAFVRRVFGERAKALGLVTRAGESDDDQLLRRALIRFVGAEEPVLAAEARRATRAWLADRTAIDPGLAETVLIVAAQTGDASLFDAMLAEARATGDRLDRRHLIVALFSYADPVLARRGLALMSDEGFDIRELGTALWISHGANPPRRVVHEVLAANLDVLAKRMHKDSPGGWPEYADKLCTEADRAGVEAFWRDRIAGYAGGARTLAQALESIELCSKLYAAPHNDVAAYLARDR